MPTFRVFLERECTVGMWVTAEADTAKQAQENIDGIVDQCRYDPEAAQALFHGEWSFVEDFEVRTLDAEEVSAPGTGMHLEKEDGARSMLYTLCIHCQTNRVIPEPDTPEVESSCPDCGKALGVLGLALMGDDEEDEAD